MLIEVVLTIWFVLVVLVFPGFLLLSVFSDLYVVDRLLLFPGIGMALFIVVSSGVASLWKYSFQLILFVNVILGIILLVIYYRAQGFQDDSKNVLNIKFSEKNFYLVLLFILLVVFAIWRLVFLEVPGDVDAQGFGYLSLTVRLGGTINTLSPFYPEIKWLYSPGFFILAAFLSDLLSLPINYIMLGIAYFFWLMVFPAAFGVGRQIGDNRFGVLICIFLIIGRGLFTVLADSGFTSVLGCLIIIVCFSTFLRALNMESKRLGNVIVAALTLSALCLSHPDSFIFYVLAEVPFFATVWLSRKTPNIQDYTVMLLIPSIAFLMTLPWVILQFPLFFNEVIIRNLEWLHTIGADWYLGVHQLNTIIYFNGAIVILFAVLGMCRASIRRERRDVFLITWVLMIIDFSAFGIIANIASILSLNLTSHIYTGSLAWRGPFVPFSILAAQFTHYIVKQFTLMNPKATMIRKLRQLKQKIAHSGLKGVLLLSFSFITGMVFPIYAPTMLALDARHTGGHYKFHWIGRSYAPFSTHNDLVAMEWIKNNTPDDAFILNSPWYDGHWVSVIAERKAVFFPHHPHSNRPFQGVEGVAIHEVNVMQDECRQAFYHPDCKDSRSIIYKYGITYVIVPDGKLIAHRHDALDSDAFNRANYLQLVFRDGDAKVYRVINS